MGKRSAILVDSNGEEFLDECGAIAEMLDANILFIGGDRGPFWTGGKEENPATIWVNCNDVWFWGCADAEPVPYDQIEPLYRAFKARGYYGTEEWACVRRNMQPQAPIRERNKEAGEWSDIMEALPKNPDELPSVSDTKEADNE